MNKIILISLCLVLFCCSKNDDDTIDNQRIQNTIWIDAKTGTDTLRFTEDLLLRGPRDYSGQQMDLCGHPYWGIYSYSLKNNLLLLDWEGAEKIYFIKPFEYKISIHDNTLIINNFIDCYYPREKFQTDTFLLIASNCSKEFIEGYLVLDNKLVGTWIEKNPEMFDGIMDTIVFTKDALVKKHIVFDGWCYSAISDTIVFGKDGKEIKCAYTISNDNELTIYNFIDRLITQDVKNMQFVRIEE